MNKGLKTVFETVDRLKPLIVDFQNLQMGNEAKRDLVLCFQLDTSTIKIQCCNPADKLRSIVFTVIDGEGKIEISGDAGTNIFLVRGITIETMEHSFVPMFLVVGVVLLGQIFEFSRVLLVNTTKDRVSGVADFLGEDCFKLLAEVFDEASLKLIMDLFEDFGLSTTHSDSHDNMFYVDLPIVYENELMNV